MFCPSCVCSTIIYVIYIVGQWVVKLGHGPGLRPGHVLGYEPGFGPGHVPGYEPGIEGTHPQNTLQVGGP